MSIGSGVCEPVCLLYAYIHTKILKVRELIRIIRSRLCCLLRLLRWATTWPSSASAFTTKMTRPSRRTTRPRLHGTRKRWSRASKKAQFTLALRYENGFGVAQDAAAAAAWYAMAAVQGSAEAKLRLGALYMLGRGVAQDFNAAAVLFAEIAAQGHAEALFSLGVLYENGMGVSQDLTAAAKWSRRRRRRAILVQPRPATRRRLPVACRGAAAARTSLKK